MNNRGFWGVAISCPKYTVNTGSLWRSADIMGADVLVLIDPEKRGEMHRKRLIDGVAGTRRDYALSGIPGVAQASDVLSSARHMPVICVSGSASIRETFPTARIVGVECPDVAKRMGRESVQLRVYQHYERAIYILGAEDNGLRREDIEQCDDLIYIESARSSSLNLACAGTVVCADRFAKMARASALAQVTK